MLNSFGLIQGKGFDHTVNRLWLDMDGVLADFDGSALPMFQEFYPWIGSVEVFDQTYGQDEFWRIINSNPNFFRELALMPDAMELYDSVKHLNPGVITGIPRDMDPLNNQKLEWAREHFPDIEDVFCCRAKKKNEHMIPGDVIVDDRTPHIKAWTSKGGFWVLHKNAKRSIAELKVLGVL